MPPCPMVQKPSDISYPNYLCLRAHPSTCQHKTRPFHHKHGPPVPFHRSFFALPSEPTLCIFHQRNPIKKTVNPLTANVLRHRRCLSPLCLRGHHPGSVIAGNFFQGLRHGKLLFLNNLQMNAVFQCVLHTSATHPPLAGRIPTPSQRAGVTWKFKNKPWSLWSMMTHFF